MEKVKIVVNKNGSLRLYGVENVELIDSDGNAFDLSGKETFSLCRCGLSQKKPFCDGTHKNGTFEHHCVASPLG